MAVVGYKWRTRSSDVLFEVIKPFVDVVNVEGRDSHQVSLCTCTYGCVSQKEQPKCVALAGIILPVERNGKPRRACFRLSVPCDFEVEAFMDWRDSGPSSSMGTKLRPSHGDWVSVRQPLETTQ